MEKNEEINNFNETKSKKRFILFNENNNEL